ncbi:MAG: thiamine pyrophosphate-dependent enzyme [Gemmatimonadota bacterium]
MLRFPAFDPPEYATWTPDPALVREFAARIGRDESRRVIIERLGREDLLELYRRLVIARLQDIGLKRWVRQGVISKAWLGTGEEATTVGPVFALDRAVDYVSPMIRNQSACGDMGMPIADVFRGYLAAANGPSRGRDVHIGSMAHHVVPPVSPVGVMVPVCAGIAMVAQMRGERSVVMTWIGDGSAKAGPSHEGLNFAAVRKVPAIFIIQNNQVALGTRLDQHHTTRTFDGWPGAYGVAGWSFDGNNVLDAFAATRLAAERCRKGEGPVILLAETFRMGGHATHDEREARSTFPADLFAYWGQRDPIGLYEEFLKGSGIRTEELVQLEHAAAEAVDSAAEEALADRDHLPAPESALDGVYATNSQDTSGDEQGDGWSHDT